MIVPPYDKNSVDAYTRARVILMNGIENNSVLTSHAIARMIDNDEIKRQLALTDELPGDWPSFAFREEMNTGGVPSEDIVKRAEKIVA